MDLGSQRLLGGFGMTCLVTEEADRVGRPSSAADSLSGERLGPDWCSSASTALMEAEVRGGGHSG